MTGRLIDAVRQIDADVTAEELTDTVWLLGEIYRRRGAPPTDPGRPADLVPPSGDDPGPAPPPEVGPPADRPGPPPLRPGPDRGWPVTGPSPDPVAEWHLPRHDRLLESPAQPPVRSPGATALGATLALGRALRPLRRRMPSRTAVVLDEEATVRRAVDGGLWIPATRPALDRWLDLAVVVDDSASMVIWRRTAAEFRELMTRVGGFRDIRVWRCDTDLRDGGRLSVRPEGTRAGAPGRDVRELVDPTGRRLVLVISDCVGRAWATGEMSGALRRWGLVGPVAIVQTLPPRLWEACAPEFVPVRLAARRPGVPNAALEVRAEPYVPPEGAVAIPVLTLEARSFTPWATLVSGAGAEFMAGTAIFADGSGGGPPPPAGPVVASAEEVLDRYVSFASTEAIRLAVCLAGAPLSLPVMRLVQQAMLPGSHRSVLAEVFLGGLLRQREQTYDRSTDPDEVEYDFAPGVRDRLLDALSRHDKLTVLAKVSDFVAARLGSPMDFRAFLSAAEPAAELLRRHRPFAQVALRVLEDIGGRYAEAATALRRKLPPQTTLTAQDTPKAQITVATVGVTDNADAHLTPATPDPGEDVTVSTPPTQPPLQRPETGPGVTSGDSVQPRIFGNVPYRNPHFTGRGNQLDQLRTTLTQGTSRIAMLPHALHGLGGVGKTQLAVEYAYRYAPDYDLVWWVPAESLTGVRASLAQLAEEMGLPSADVPQAISNVLGALRTGQPYRRWLIVFDNADRPDELREYLPVPLGHVLITSRNPHWADVAAQLEVDVFDREESVALLQRRGRGITAADAAELADKLGDLPLALDQAAAWQAETGMPVRDMIRLLDDRLRQLLDEHPRSSYPATVMATWDLAFSRLRERSPGAAQLLELCAFFGSEPIAVSLLWDGRHADLPTAVGRVLRDDILLRRAIREMHRYALAKVDPTRDRIEVHRLVQAVLREQMTPEQREKARDAVHGILAMANPGDPDNPKNWDRHAELSPHVTSSGVVDARSDAARRVALDQIRYRYIRADSLRSAALGEAVFGRWRDALGPDHELTLLAERNLGNALRELGEGERAAALTTEAFERLRAAFGEDHEHTLRTASGVAVDLRLRGEFQRAREIDEQNLERHRRVFARDDPELIRAMNNVAVNLRLVGDFTGALAIDTEVYELNEAILGAEHPSTCLALANVARNLFDAGRYRESYDMLNDALPRLQARLGESSRVILITRRVLAMVQRRLGAFSQARELAEELYQGARQLFRPDHERMLSTMVTYANALLAVGELTPARSLADQAVQRYRHRYGDQHPFSVAAAVDLGVIMRAAGEHRAARELDRSTLEIGRRELDASHPFVLYALLGLGNDCAAAHDHQQARELSAEAYGLARRTRGADHPDTLICALNHSLDLRATGEREPADALLGEVLPRLRQALGDDHPQVAAAVDGVRAEGDIEIWAM